MPAPDPSEPREQPTKELRSKLAEMNARKPRIRDAGCVPSIPDRTQNYGANAEFVVPAGDRNPQKFVNIPDAKAADFQKATERVYHGSSVSVTVIE